MSTYAKIEHSLYDNPKIVGLSCEAFRAYVEGILYSGKNLTDGFLDERIVARMWGVQVAEELTNNDPANPSWERVDGGWLIYGFTERQNTKESVDAKREQKRAAANARWEKAKSKTDAQAMQNEYKTDAEPMHSAYKSDAKGMPDTDTDTDTNKNINRATRIKEDWNLDDELLEWTRTTAPGLNIVIEREKFIDYWISKAGSTATKTDWNRTWKNWVRSNVERNPMLAVQPVVASKRKFTGYVD